MAYGISAKLLKGVLFRGGANNSYNRNGVRGNKNPLPQNGLANICVAGFQTAIYLLLYELPTGCAVSLW